MFFRLSNAVTSYYEVNIIRLRACRTSSLSPFPTWRVSNAQVAGAHDVLQTQSSGISSGRKLYLQPNFFQSKLLRSILLKIPLPGHSAKLARPSCWPPACRILTIRCPYHQGFLYSSSRTVKSLFARIDPRGSVALACLTLSDSYDHSCRYRPEDGVSQRKELIASTQARPMMDLVFDRSTQCGKLV